MAIAIQADVPSAEDVEAMSGALPGHSGRPDSLVAGSGMRMDRPLAQMQPGQGMRMRDANPAGRLPRIRAAARRFQT